MTKIDNFRQFCSKSRFFDNFDHIWEFSTIFTKIYIFEILTKSRFLESFYQNRDICKFWPKSTPFQNFDQNQDWGKFLSQFDFPKILTKIEIFRKCWPKSRFFVNFDKNRDFHKYWPKSKFSNKFHHKSRFFQQLWPKSRFSSILTQIEIYRNIDQNRNFGKPKSRISDNFDQKRDFSKILTTFEIFINFYQDRDFVKFCAKSKFFW